ncbi:hypothetical protein ALC62_12436 [Cyphomyrmex costatus]|uniref:HAT C-terminal dimerisation domain-containing protein n=2 Tax=Cyphomyrmex costatus TaxID=456900 RepID=A0A151IB86_9HYME|nr:hypothetical protein ALC62_12436 [Cyphomyrmex costatus]
MDSSNQPSTSCIEEKKRSRRKVFQYSWLSIDTFKDWLMPHENDEKALCSVCNKVISCGKSDLTKHSLTKLHINNINKNRNITPSALLHKLESNVTEKKDHVNKVKTAEIKISAFYAEHNIAFQTVDHMVPLLKATCSDPQVVNDLKLSRQKCTQIVKNVLGKRETEKLITNLKSQKFSILIDESTSISNDKLLCILVKYVSLENKKCITQLLELVPLDANECTADKLYSAFKECLENKGIPLSNIVGMASDNASVMIGVRDSFVTRLKKEVPALVVLKCICHSSALIASKACSKLPDSCENVLHAVATYFSISAKRSAILREFQNFFGVESRKILKLSGTRWLVLQKCVTRLLDNWEVLKHYFHLETVENKNNSAITIFNILNDNKIKAYMFFLKYALKSFNEFNALFQGRQILIHKLSESSEHLIKQMGYNFLLPHSLQNISIDVINPQNFLPTHSIYVGPECESLLELESLEFVIEVKTTCLSFYETALEGMIQRLPYNDEFFRELKFLDPAVALQEESRLTFPDLRNLAKRFQISDIDLVYEWRMLPIVFDDANKTLLTNLEIHDMWKTIFQKKKPNNKPFFPNLENLVNIVMSLPHSNAEAERIFSIVTDVKNKKRNRIDVTSLDAICKVRSSFQANNIDCRTFQVDSTHLELHNSKNLFSRNSCNNQHKDQ